MYPTTIFDDHVDVPDFVTPALVEKEKETFWNSRAQTDARGTHLVLTLSPTDTLSSTRRARIRAQIIVRPYVLLNNSNDALFHDHAPSLRLGDARSQSTRASLPLVTSQHLYQCYSA